MIQSLPVTKNCYKGEAFMKSKAITLLVVTGIVLCLFSCGQPESPSAATTSNVTTGQDTPILLWDWGNNGYSLSMSEDGTTSTPLNATAYTYRFNHCWDDDGTLWYTSSDEDYTYTLMKRESDTDCIQITAGGFDVYDIDYDAANGRFFVVYDDNSSYKLKVIDEDVMKNAPNLLEADGDVVSLVHSNDYPNFTAGSVENNTYCAIFDDGWGRYEMRAFTYTPGAAELKATYELSTSTELFGTSYYNIGYDSRFFTDIQIADGNIYVLGRQNANVSAAWNGNVNVAISRGGVFKFTLNGTAFVYKGVAGLQQVLDVTKKFLATEDEDPLYKDDQETPLTFETTIHSGIPEKDSSTLVLLSPQKFIAIKPKKLVIADCGVVWVRDADELSDFEKQSRLASVDLESFSVTSEPYTANFGDTYPPGTAFAYEVAVTGQTAQVYCYDPGNGYCPITPDTYIQNFDWFFD